MKIFASKTHIDLEAPIQMTKMQQEKFIEFLQKMFPDISVVYDFLEASKTMPDDMERTHIAWTIDDYLTLLEPKSNEDIEEKLGRTEMSVKMKRGAFVPDFYSWMSSKGYTPPMTKEIVEEFLKERGEN
jgi:hypothetical protein